MKLFKEQHEIEKMKALMRIPSGVTDVHRGRRATSFTAHLPGRGAFTVVAPSKAIIDRPEAQRLNDLLSRARLERGETFELGEENRLEIRERKEHSLILRTARPPQPDTETYALPETVASPTSPIFTLKGSPPREYYFDSLKIESASAELAGKIEIGDKTVADFVRAKLQQTEGSRASAYYLVYHNYRDQETGQIGLKADAVVLAHQVKETTYVLVHKWKGSILAKLPLEMVLEEHPLRVVASADEVRLSRKLYGDIYERVELKTGTLPESRIRDEWPFALPKANLIEVRRPRIPLREKWRLYREAMRQDLIFGLAAIGGALHSAGKGLFDGALLYSIWNLAQGSFKVAALLGVLTKLGLIFYMMDNARSAAEAEHLEARERLGEELNKQFPLWEMGQRYKTLTLLIKRYTKISLAYIGAQLVYFSLFPPIFTGLFGLGGVAAGIFLGGFLLAEILTVKTDAFDIRTGFKIAESRLRDKKEFKKNFWTIHAFQDNLGIVVNQACFILGLGLSTLVSLLAPAWAPAAGIAMGGLSLLLFAARFLLPIFGRVERTRLTISQPNYLRVGKSLKFSDNVSLELGEDRKVEVIDQDELGRILVPGFERSQIKIKVRNLKSVTLKSNWLGRVLPFDFVRKHKIFIRTQDESDPILVYTVYGGEAPQVEDFVRDFLIIS